MRIVSRAEWGAITEENRPAMRLPAREVWLHHSVTPVSNDPNFDMRLVQRIGISRFGYLSYSYAFHPKGTILEGQGLRVGAHTAKRNSISLGFVLIGDYTTRQPTDAQIESVRWLITRLRAEGHLRPGTYPTGGHRDVKSTACPGDRAYAALSQFRRHWDSAGPPAPPAPMEVVLPMYNPPITIGSPVVATLKAPGGGLWMLCENGAIYAWECADRDAPNRHPEYWVNRRAARLEPLGAGYVVVDSTGARYEYP